MEADREEVEVVIAQRLASGEPTTRKRAFRALCTWIRDESTAKEFGADSMARLCKGLHYVLWMQDKMLLQESLADEIASLVNVFSTEVQSVLFVRWMLVSISNEWALIDRWRMDKFLMFVRRLLRALFARLRDKGWEPSTVALYLDAFKHSAISPDPSFCEGLKFHFASIYLDELDHAGGIRQENVIDFLEPYFTLIADKKISRYLFGAVLHEIFGAILHAYAEERAEEAERKEEAAGDGEDDAMGDSEQTSQQDDRLKFNYAEIGKRLFDIGKSPEVRNDRRKNIYRMAQQFKAAEAGEEPFEMATKEATRLKAIIPKRDVLDATSKLINEHAKDVAAREKAKRKKKAAKRAQQLLQNEPKTSIVEVKTKKISPQKEKVDIARRKPVGVRKKVKTTKKGMRRRRGKRTTKSV